MTREPGTAQARWEPANNGTGKRIWFLYRDDNKLPVRERYHFGANGRLARYASYEAAQRAAGKLNRTLTERRKGDRAELARQVAEMATRHGLAADVVPEREGIRHTEVAVSGPHGLGVWVIFSGRSPHAYPDTYVLSWHGVETGWRLRPDAFGDVNLCHGHKATDVARGSGDLLALLERRFAAIADGSAFEQHSGHIWAEA